MGFYVQDDMWEAVSTLPKKTQDEVLGAICRLYFEGEMTDLNGFSKSLLVAFRDRILLSKTRSNCGKQKAKQIESKTEAKANQKRSNGKANPKSPIKEGEGERDRDREKVSANADTENPRAKFEPPTAEEVMEYAAKMGYEYYRDRTKAEHFLAYYGERGWLKGNGKPVGNWKNTLRNWNANDVSKYGEKAPSVRIEASDYAIYD